jgi:D-alanyl-D-alanine carboxypeptidase
MNKLEPIVLKLVKKSHIPHVIMAAERGDGSNREETAKGIRNPDGSIVTPATPYFIASIGKLFTASVVLKLSEQGKIDIENPAKNYSGR